MRQRYPFAMRFIHWLTVVCLLAMLFAVFMSYRLGETNPALSEVSLQAHMSLGMLMLILLIARLVYRMRAMPSYEDPRRKWAHVGHFLIYGLLAGTIITGYTKLALLGYPVLLVWGLSLPALPFNPEIANAMRTAHEVFAIVLGVLLAGHVGFALLHRRLLGNDVLHRMI